MREEAEVSLDEILNEAGVAEGEELDEQAQKVVSMLPEYIDQDDPESFVTHIREETATYGNERALLSKVMAVLQDRGDVTGEFATSVHAFLDVEAKRASGVNEDEVAVEELETELEGAKLDFGAEPA